MSKLKFILSGGGTGGHIYPAIAIANELKKRFPEAEFLFVGAKDKMEMQKVPQAGYAIKGLWIAGLQRKLTLQNGQKQRAPIGALCFASVATSVAYFYSATLAGFCTVVDILS